MFRLGKGQMQAQELPMETSCLRNLWQAGASYINVHRACSQEKAQASSVTRLGARPRDASAYDAVGCGSG